MVTHHARKDALFLYSLFLIIVFFFLVGTLVAGYIVREERKLSEQIFPNVYIDNVPVGRKTKNQAVQLFSDKNKKLGKLALTVIYKDLPIATISAQKINVKTSIGDVVERAYLIGRVTHLPSRVYQKLTTLFNIGRFDFTTAVVYDKDSMNEFIAEQEQRYNKPAKNALFKFENNRVVSFRPEEKGARLESDSFRTEVDEAIAKWKNKPQDAVITLTEKVIEPEITLAKSNQFGIEELIGEGKSDYSHSIPGRIHNVILASSKFNGVLIPPGETLSFNDTVGDISSSTGYQPAYIIKSGKTVLGDGGGVCQVSTTLFRAALNTGLPILERTAHAYRVGYYENDSKPGFDATVYAPSVDLKIKNDTPAYILIQTEADRDNSLLFFRLYGKRDKRVVEISPPALYDVSPPPPPAYQDDPTLKRGTTKQVDFAAWGGKASFSYRVKKNNQLVFEKTFFSSYRPWQAVFLVGQAD